MQENERKIGGLRLVQTCSSHPEQYDVYAGRKLVGYLRLRGGVFRCDYPTHYADGGRTIYEACPHGDGEFDDDERLFYLRGAVKAIKENMPHERKRKR